MKLLCLSDSHAQFYLYPPDELPDADLCLIGGDITNVGYKSSLEMLQAKEWMRELTKRYFVMWIPGNHDIGFTADRNPFPFRMDCHADINIMDQQIPFKGFIFRGVNLSPCYDLPKLINHWDHMTIDPEEEARAYDMPYCDILLSHCPPYGFCDQTNEGKHIGSKELTKYIEKHQPKLVVCGHVHESAGQAMIGRTRIYNVAQSMRVINFD